jgi:hypothetical protein
MHLLNALRTRRTARAARRTLRRWASALLGTTRTARADPEWHAGDIAWYPRLDGVGAAVVESVTPQKVTLAIGSSRYAYECGFSPTDPPLFHSKGEAVRYILAWRSRIVRVMEHDSCALRGKPVLGA